MPQAKYSLLLILLTVMAAAAVQRYVQPPGGLQVAPLQAQELSHTFQTGRRVYPRFVTDADGFRVRIPKPATRIVSQYWSLDDYVYALTPPQNVIGVSSTAYEPGFSNVLPEVERFKPVIATDPERVLRLNPDLILVSSTSRADFTSLVRSTGVPVVRIHTSFASLQEVEATIRITGYVTGADDTAKRVADQFHQTLIDAQKLRKPGAHSPRILGLGGTYSYGKRTLFDNIATTLGAVNVGSQGGLDGYSAIDSEQILRWNPEWIFAGADSGKTDQVLRQLLNDPAVSLTQAARRGHVIVFDNKLFLPMSPYTARLVKAMAEALYPQASRNAKEL